MSGLANRNDKGGIKDFEMPWLIACVAFFLMAGFAKFSTVVVNRLLAAPQPKWLIGFTEMIQVLLISIYAGLVFASLRHGGLQSLSDISQQYPGGALLCVLILVGAAGLVQLVYSAIAFQLYRPPACQTAVDSQIVDARQSVVRGVWTETLVGQRPMRGLALVPFNEQFKVEVATKTFALPRLPKEWDGLSIVHLSDTHFRGAVASAYFEFVCQKAIELKPDLFVFTGDLLDDIALLDWLPKTLGSLQATHGQYFILGNHDWYLDAPATRRRLEQVGWTDVAGRTLDLRLNNPGPSIVLAGDETPWMGTHPDLSSSSKDQFQILLSHTPDNINWARSQNVDLMLSGHTHGGQIRLPGIGPIYSPSKFGCRFASGVFWMEPTLMYVSRGISGREPIRYGCVPELTKLVLTTCGEQPTREPRHAIEKSSCQQ